MKRGLIAVFAAFVAVTPAVSAQAVTRAVFVNTSSYRLDIEVHFGRYVKSEVVRPRGRLTLPEGKSYLAVMAVDDQNRQICTSWLHVYENTRQITFAVKDRKCTYQRV